MPVAIWSGNKLQSSEHLGFLQFLDASLMQGNMRGWAGMQELLTQFPDAFSFYKMTTKSRHRGAMLECRSCGKACKLHWEQTANLNCEKLERCRQCLRQFLGFGTDGKPKNSIR